VSPLSPYTFDEAHTAATRASQAHRVAEDNIRHAFREWGNAERAYRVALAQRITELHADGVAWTVTADLARGDRKVAQLRVARDIAAGVKEAAVQAGWRASKDREDTTQLIQWSMRRELAEIGVGG
jgi:hypothetical protein